MKHLRTRQSSAAASAASPYKRGSVKSPDPPTAAEEAVAVGVVEEGQHHPPAPSASEQKDTDRQNLMMRQQAFKKKSVNRQEYHMPGIDSDKGRAWLAVACCWPLVLWILLLSSTSTRQSSLNSRLSLEGNSTVAPHVGFDLRKWLDRVDVMGYGPTHPRVGFVVFAPIDSSAKGDDDNTNGSSKAIRRVIETVQSIFTRTDRNRIFSVCVVMDGHRYDQKLAAQLEKMDPRNKRVASLASIVHVIFNDEPRGISESRADGALFVKLLAKQHERAGLKSNEEDLLVVFVEAGAKFAGNWLPPVTEALIVPPPILGEGDSHESVAMKLANAVAFNHVGAGRRTGVDVGWRPVISDASATDLSLSNGASYPTPVFDGGAIAMRLDTYMMLPLQDLSLKDSWSANLDLSFNLWLCADGIDMVNHVNIIVPDDIADELLSSTLSTPQVARFAAVWIDEATQKKVFSARDGHLTNLEWETMVAHAKHEFSSTAGTQDMHAKCRSFSWYVKNVNVDMARLFPESEGHHPNAAW